MRKKYAMDMINNLVAEFDGYAKDQRNKAQYGNRRGDCINVAEAVAYEKCAKELRELSRKMDSYWGTDMKELIADRATESGTKNFYKSYIKDIKRVAYRTKEGYLEPEEDFTFRYDGAKYRINEKLFGSKDGTITYEVIKL